MTGARFARRNRGQSHVIGVAILLGVTMVSLGMLTASVGTVVEQSAGAADADRVAAAMDGALEPVEATGPARGRIAFTEGHLAVVTRSIRVLNRSGVVAQYDLDTFVFSAGESRVAFTAGAVIRGRGSAARRYTAPPISASDQILLVGIADLNTSGPDTISGTAPTTVFVQTNVHHRRQRLDEGEYRVAVETATPIPWERHFAAANATTTRRDFDDDGVPSVVGTYPGNRTVYLVVHDLRTVIRSA